MSAPRGRRSIADTINVIRGDHALSVGDAAMAPPAGWQWKKLTDIARLESGHTPSRQHAHYWNGNVPWLSIGDARRHHGGRIASTAQQVTQAGIDNSAARVLPKNTVCLSRTASVGYVTVMDRPMATSQDFVNWVCSPEIDPDFLKYLLVAEKDALLRFGKGSTHTTIYFPEVQAFRVCAPVIDEQRRIAAKLDALRARTRRAKNALDAVPALLDRLRQSILAAAFRGDLTADWREANPDVEPASELLKRIRVERRKRWEGAELAKLVAKGKSPKDDRWKSKYVDPEPVDDTDLPELPDGWCWANAEEVTGADIIYGIIQPGPEVPDGVPYVRGMDIQDGAILVAQLHRTSPEIAARYSRATLKSGDVLLGIIRATKVAIVPSELEGANITQGTARVRPVPELKTTYIAGWLESPFAQNWLHAHYRGIDMPGLNLSDVRRLPVPVCCWAEQVAIAERLNVALSTWKTLELAAREASDETTGLDASILAAAFRGKLLDRQSLDAAADQSSPT